MSKSHALPEHRNRAYIYYVATLSRYVLIPADNAREALEAGERHPDLDGRTVLTVRVATKSEIELMDWHEQMLAES
jgi:hypothetical protein